MCTSLSTLVINRCISMTRRIARPVVALALTMIFIVPFMVAMLPSVRAAKINGLRHCVDLWRTVVARCALVTLVTLEINRRRLHIHGAGLYVNGLGLHVHRLGLAVHRVSVAGANHNAWHTNAN